MESMTKNTVVRRGGTAVAAAALIAVLAGCGASAGGAEKVAQSKVSFDLKGQTLRIGTAAEQPLDIGTSYGLELLAGWGADVKREELTSISGLEAIVAGQIDVSGRSSDEVVDGNARDFPLVAFGAGASEMHYVLIGSPNIKQVSDMAGKKIAISGPGGFDTLLIDAILEKEGLDPAKDVTQVPIGGSGERTAAVLVKQADVAMVFMDNWFALEAKGADVGLIGYVAEILPGLSSRAFAAKRGYLDDNPEMALAIACANLESNRWIKEDKDSFVDFTLKRVKGTTTEGIGAFYDRAIDLKMFPSDPELVLPPESFQATADLMFEAGAIDASVDAKEFVDTSYLKEAAKMGCGAS
jgi:NitT/TauT family transport system substrate-binding protein